MDGTMKLWDLRQTKAPTKVLRDLDAYFPTCNPCFSPDGTIVATGTSVHPNKKSDDDKSGESGMITFFDVHSADEEPIYAIAAAAPSSSVVCLHWHPRINHILCGTSTGVAYAYYDPALSQKGVMLSAGRKCRPKDKNDYVPEGVVHNPHALPMFRDEIWGKRKRAADRKDPIKSRRPELPHTGPGHGGKVAKGNEGVKLNQIPSIREQDPREELLKYAKLSKDDPMFLGAAYAKSQPATILQHDTLEEEQKTLNEDAKAPSGGRRPLARAAVGRSATERALGIWSS
jgi:hypothetical protein